MAKQGKTYTITGLNIRSKKFPVLTDKDVRFNADYLRGIMTGDPKLFERIQKEKRNKKLEQAREDYSRACSHYGLERLWLDKTFVDRGTTYRIDGVMLSARRFNVLCRKENNDVTYFQSEYVAKLMKEQHPEKKKAA